MLYYKVLDESSDYLGRTGKVIGELNNYYWLEFSDGKTTWVIDKRLKPSYEYAYRDEVLVFNGWCGDIRDYNRIVIKGVEFKRVN